MRWRARVQLGLGAVGLAAILIGARGQSTKPGDKSAFRRFTLASDPLDKGGGAADLSPNGTEVAVQATVLKRESRQFWGIQFWDYRRPQIEAARPLAPAPSATWDDRHPIAYTEHFIRYSPDGHFLLAFDGVTTLALLTVAQTEVHLLRTIDLGLSAERPTLRPADLQWSPDGERAAVLFSWRNFHEGVVRAYGIGTGQPLWQRSFTSVETGHAAWSPDGRKLAVTLLSGEKHTGYPPRDTFNLVILSGDSGRTLTQIETGDLAGPVCFGLADTVATAPLHYHPQSRNWFRPDRATVWNALDGGLIRHISSPGRDIHDYLELSRDGAVLLAYVGREKSGPSLRAMGEDVERVVDERFQLFDYATGRLLATSPDLREPGLSCGNALPSFRLGPAADRVLVYWPIAACAPSVFELGGPEDARGAP